MCAAQCNGPAYNTYAFWGLTPTKTVQHALVLHKDRVIGPDRRRHLVVTGEIEIAGDKMLALCALVGPIGSVFHSDRGLGYNSRHQSYSVGHTLPDRLRVQCSCCRDFSSQQSRLCQAFFFCNLGSPCSKLFDFSFQVLLANVIICASGHSSSPAKTLGLNFDIFGSY